MRNTKLWINILWVLPLGLVGQPRELRFLA